MADDDVAGERLTESAQVDNAEPLAKAEPAAVAQNATPAKKTPPKKSAAKRKAPAKKSTSKSTTGQRTQTRFPRHSVEKALRIPKAIYEQNAGKPSAPEEAAKFTGAAGVSGSFNVEVSSAKKYGFLKSEAGRLVLEDRARRAIAPQTDTERRDALREALLAAPDLSEIYNHYRGENLPDDQFFRNALTDRFGISADKVAEFEEVFGESIRAAELLDESGDRPKLLDVGRDESHRAGGEAGSKPQSTAVASEGGSCFVMMPFSGQLGTYYEAIFRPAIEQSGLHPVRADDEIFATGKIMDQVWRGIRQATVLVAELTTKNPNVFYELGLAHALEKPVVLISSNQEDVPFDLRHIRAILYDKDDPFWGQKLIDKVADNISSALRNPEEAIFRANE